MPEVATIDRAKSRKVQVASLPPADSGRGFARLPDKLMDDLGLNEGDVIEIVGTRSTAVLASMWTTPFGAALTTTSRSSCRAKAGALSSWRMLSGMSALIR